MIVPDLSTVNPEWTHGWPPLAVGKRYRVKFDDCCVRGHFDSVFVGYQLTPNKAGDPPNFPTQLVFSDGEISCVTPEELP